MAADFLALHLKRELTRLAGSEFRRIYIAYSGGPDSSALLSAASVLAKQGDIPVPEAVYVDHQLRPEKELVLERRHLRESCERFDLSLRICSCKRGEIEEYARQMGCGLEAASRVFRYRFFDEICGEDQYTFMLLAHTRDDQMETLLKRFFEGAGIEAMGGIPERRGPYIRPLLRIEKSRLFSYLEDLKISYSVDSSNSSDCHLRNSMRRHLIPGIERVFPAYREALERFSRKQRMAEAFLSEAIVLPEFRWEDKVTLSWSRDDFLELSLEGRRRLVYRAFEAFQREERLPYAMVERIITSEFPPGKRISAFSGELFSSGGRIFWKRDVVLRGKNRYIKQIQSGERIEIPRCGSFSIRFYGLKEPLLVRNRAEGDEILFEYGKKRLKKLFQEWNVPEEERAFVPVLEDRTGIVAVLGSCLGFPDVYAAGIRKNGIINMEFLGESRKQT